MPNLQNGIKAIPWKRYPKTYLDGNQDIGEVWRGCLSKIHQMVFKAEVSGAQKRVSEYARFAKVAKLIGADWEPFPSRV